jgi:hypothetical protein
MLQWLFVKVFVIFLWRGDAVGSEFQDFFVSRSDVPDEICGDDRWVGRRVRPKTMPVLSDRGNAQRETEIRDRRQSVHGNRGTLKGNE